MAKRLRRVFTYLFTILFVLGVRGSLWSLDPQKALAHYKIDIWQVEQGFAQNVVDAIIQTRDGYLWLGTLDGLIRFDGIRFTQFNKQKYSQFKGNEIRSLFEDSDGTLWIGTDGGLTCYKNGVFTAIKTEKNEEFNTLTSIIKDSKGTIWVGCKFGGVGFVKGDTLVSYKPKEHTISKKIFSILEDSQGNMWFGGEGGLTKRTPLGHFITYTTESGLDCDFVYQLCSRKNGELWIGTDNGLYQYHEQGRRFNRYGLEEGLPNIQVTTLYEDRDQNLLGGTDGGGLIRVRDGKIETLGTEDGLASGLIYAICEDHEGSLWVGTLEGGLHRLRDSRFTTYTVRQGLAHDSVNCVFEGRGGMIWVGTEGGVSRLNDGKVDRTITMDNGLLSNFVNDITEDNSGALWISMDNGLQRIKDGTLMRFSARDGLPGDSFGELCSDRNGSIWIGTSLGLTRYNEGKFSLFTQKDGLAGIEIYVIYESHSGEIWVSTENGDIDRLNNGSITRISAQQLLIRNTVIECIHEDSEGVIYIGSRSGLTRIKGGIFTNFTTTNGLSDNFVNTILEDDLGTLWIGSRTGLSRVSKKELEDFANGKINTIHPISFNEEDGMISRWCRSKGWKSRNGKLWIPTVKGLVMVDPARIKSNLIAPPVIIEEITIDGESGYSSSGLTNLSKENPLVIPPGKKRIEFHYTALSFLKPRKIKFKLKLEGFDSDWVEVGNIRNNTYAALSPGHYNFRVLASNSDGIWNKTGAAIPFVLEPYFYNTTWFYVISVLVVTLLTFLAFRMRVNQLKARQRELRRLVDIRTKALNERTVQLETAHDSLRHSTEIIEEKNRNILSSIQYARKIQQAILPSSEHIESVLQDHFILFKPRDIVSGDFYWFNQSEGKYYVAVVDCTGHGVPGALLSMIGNMRLNEVIDEAYIPDPAQLLMELHAGVRNVLQQESDHSDSSDGMDVALCMLDLNEGRVIFSGARRPILFGRAGRKFEVIRGSRDAIGGRMKKKQHIYINHEIEIVDDMTIYLTSDGFADQNNYRNKKYGSHRLKEFLQSIVQYPMAVQREMLFEELELHQGNEEQRDDITIIGLKLKKI
jgi:ligand-binding sensor domain-containing protein/serine phosphatase RsbU (regulator of sigma subunit)